MFKGFFSRLQLSNENKFNRTKFFLVSISGADSSHRHFSLQLLEHQAEDLRAGQHRHPGKPDF
jgi:hypothetical protein